MSVDMVNPRPVIYPRQPIRHSHLFAVGVVASDDDALESPSPRDRELTVLQVEEMTRRAVDLIGGMASVSTRATRTAATTADMSWPENSHRLLHRPSTHRPAH